jgi:hypothetical protein
MNLGNLITVYLLLDNLIENEIKYTKYVIFQILELYNEIMSYIDLLIVEYYFINIIEFDCIKNKILYKLSFVKNIFQNNKINDEIAKKIDNIIGIVETITYPANANLNNTVKYIDEIKKINTIKFYHKPNTLNNKNYNHKNYNHKNYNTIDEKYDSTYKEYRKKLKNKKKLQNEKKLQNKDLVIKNNLKGMKFVRDIDFTNSIIII